MDAKHDDTKRETILDLAYTIGEIWLADGIVNTALLDELAKRTQPNPRGRVELLERGEDLERPRRF